jgi:ribose-phosphate pyrophosphokinase
VFTAMIASVARRCGLPTLARRGGLLRAVAGEGGTAAGRRYYLQVAGAAAAGLAGGVWVAQDLAWGDDARQAACEARETAAPVVGEGETYFDKGYDYVKIIAGSSNPRLAKEIGEKLGVGCSTCEIGRYADGEIRISLDENIRGKDVYIVASGGPPINDHLVELLLLVSTAQRASAKRVTAVIPYFPYSLHRKGVAVSTALSSRFVGSMAADLGRMLEVMGVDRVIGVDMEKPGGSNKVNFFTSGVPVETLLTTHMMAEHIAKHSFGPNYSGRAMVVSSSSALFKKAVNFHDILSKNLPDADVGLTSFVHSSSSAGPVDVNTNRLMDLMVQDVAGRDVVLIDELIDTGGTLAALSRKLMNAGAKSVTVYSSHALPSAEAAKQIQESPITAAYALNTVQVRGQCWSTVACHHHSTLAISSHVVEPRAFAHPSPQWPEKLLKECPKLREVSIADHLSKLVYAEHTAAGDIFKEEIHFQ